jgi:hypothetical protein
MRYRANPISRKKSHTTLGRIVKKYSKKSTRREQPIQLYIKKYYSADMKEEVEREMAETEPSGSVKETKGQLKSRWFKAFRRVTQDHWDNEDDEVKEAIAEEIHAHSQGGSTSADVDGEDQEGVERKPEDYAEYV